MTDPKTSGKDGICVLVPCVLHKSDQSLFPLWELVTHFACVLGESDAMSIEAKNSIFQMHRWNEVYTASCQQFFAHCQTFEFLRNVALFRFVAALTEDTIVVIVDEAPNRVEVVLGATIRIAMF